MLRPVVGRRERSVPISTTNKAFAIILVDGYDTLLISFLAPLIAREHGLGPLELGWIFAFGYLGAVVGGLTLGPTADRIGARPILVTALLIAAAGTGACAYATSVQGFAGCRFMAGFGLGGAMPPLIAATAAATSPERRQAAVTRMYLGFPLGALIGGALTAALIDVGADRLFIGTAIACLAAASIAWTMIGVERADGRTKKYGGGSALAQFANGRLAPAMLLWVGLFGTLLVTYFLMSWTPTIIMATGGSAREAALAPVLLNGGGIIGALALSWLASRHGPFRPAIWFTLTGACCAALAGQVFGATPALMMLLLATGIGILGAQLTFPAMTAAIFPPSVLSAGAGWTMAFGRLGSIVGPLIGGWLLAAGLTADQLFLIVAGVTLLPAATLSLLLAHRLKAGV